MSNAAAWRTRRAHERRIPFKVALTKSECVGDGKPLLVCAHAIADSRRVNVVLDNNGA
ncbi:MAG: hypothetical protein KAX55_13445 [Propionivibrio sp.]|nr:hypothetical protein [Propionivibrio sp.]